MQTCRFSELAGHFLPRKLYPPDTFLGSLQCMQPFRLRNLAGSICPFARVVSKRARCNERDLCRKWHKRGFNFSTLTFKAFSADRQIPCAGKTAGSGSTVEHSGARQHGMLLLQSPVNHSPTSQTTEGTGRAQETA